MWSYIDLGYFDSINQLIPSIFFFFDDLYFQAYLRSNLK